MIRYIRNVVRRWALNRKLLNALYRFELHQFVHGCNVAGGEARVRMELGAKVSRLRAATMNHHGGKRIKSNA